MTTKLRLEGRVDRPVPGVQRPIGEVDGCNLVEVSDLLLWTGELERRLEKFE